MDPYQSGGRGGPPGPPDPPGPNNPPGPPGPNVPPNMVNPPGLKRRVRVLTDAAYSKDLTCHLVKDSEIHVLVWFWIRGRGISGRSGFQEKGWHRVHLNPGIYFFGKSSFYSHCV